MTSISSAPAAPQPQSQPSRSHGGGKGEGAIGERRGGRGGDGIQNMSRPEKTDEARAARGSRRAEGTESAGRSERTGGMKESRNSEGTQRGYRFDPESIGIERIKEGDGVRTRVNLYA